MKIYNICFLLLVLLVSCGTDPRGNGAGMQELYDTLDEEIERCSEYDKERESRIKSLREEYSATRDEGQRTAIIDRLISEYIAYNADSTLYYISKNLERPAVRSVPGEYTRMLLRRADVYAHAGLFPQAVTALQNIPRDSVSDNLLEDYYSVYCATYQYLSEYSFGHGDAALYEGQRAEYADSLSKVIKPGSFNYMTYVMAERARNGDPEGAISELKKHLAEYRPGTRDYSILASTLAYMYKTTGHNDEYRRYLVLTAISDVKAAVKENMSFRELATVMFNDGDIMRANRYLKKSIVDANYYSAMMRNVQSTKMLPVIDDAYASRQRELTRRLGIMVVVSCVLSLVLLGAVLFVRRQYKKLSVANDCVHKANAELTRLSATLRDMNVQLEARNNDLREYNATKEQYAGLFMEYCSSAISTLQQYQKSLRVAAAKGLSRQALLERLESSEASDKLLKNFYSSFDEAILNIFPSFVDRFNALLTPEGKVVLKPGELLNTELRLYALIRLGIDDSAKIAGFLRCSLSTVYTYRSKMKKRAINPEELENDVRNMTF